MPANTVPAKLESHEPDCMLLEAYIKNSEQDWMRIIRDRSNEIIGLGVCLLMSVLKRWTATLNMMAGFRRPFPVHATSWDKSILYQYIRNDALAVNVEFEWPKLPFSSVALIVAARDGYTEGVKALLKFGAAPNPTYWAGGSVLLDAVFSRSIETVRALLDAGAKDKFVESYGITAAAKAAELGELEILREIGWDANDGTVLERSLRGGKVEIVKAILAVRTEKFNFERVSRFAKDEALCKLLIQANAELPDKAPVIRVLPEKEVEVSTRWKWLSSTKEKQAKPSPKK